MMVEASYVLIPDSVIADVHVSDGYSMDNVRHNAWLRSPHRSSVNGIAVKMLSGHYIQRRQCELGAQFKLRELSGLKVPYHYLVQKGGGPSGMLANTDLLKRLASSDDPVGYFGYEDALAERTESEKLSLLGLPSCVVAGIIKLEPSKLTKYMSKIWGSNEVERNFNISQIEKIVSNGHSPALIHRHVGINCRLDDPTNSSIIRPRLREVFNLWLENDPESFRSMFDVKYKINDSQVRSLYRKYLDVFINTFLADEKTHCSFPSSPDDTDVVGMGCDYERRKKDAEIEQIKTMFAMMYQSL